MHRSFLSSGARRTRALLSSSLCSSPLASPAQSLVLASPVGVSLRRALSTPAAAGVGSIYTPTSDHGELRALVRGFAEREVEPQALVHNREERFNRALFARAGELGLLGLTASPAHGGAGLDATAVVIAHEELSASDPAFCLSYLAHSLLFVNNLAVNGSDAQRARFLPGTSSGALVGGMAMSEAGAGTDVLGMGTTATRDGDAYVLRGSKMWITNSSGGEGGTLGDVFLVYARTAPPQAAGGAKTRATAAHSLFLVEKGMKGFSLGQRILDKCGMRASSTAELVLDDVRVPASTHLVGAEGDAVAHMMRNLEIERIGLAAMSLGIARRCIDVMNAYAAERRAFGAPLNSFGQIQRHIAESYAEYAAGRAYVYATAAALDLTKGGNRVDSDGVKLYCAPMATAVASRAMQTLGGYGYVGEYVVERLWRDAKLLEIGGGTTEAHQKNITKDLRGVKLP